MARIITPADVFVITQRTDRKYVLSVGNLLIAVKETYDEAFQVIFGGKTGVSEWDNLKNKEDLFRVENEIVASVEEKAIR